MSAVLYIAAKAPRPGHVKTRLGAAIGHEHAVMLYTAFVRDLAARFAHAPFTVGWYITPSDAWLNLAPLVGDGAATARVLVQGEGDWTVRQRTLFEGASRRGEDPVVLVASDSPHLAVETVTTAFAALDTHDLVLGPTLDGGYYLIGMRGWHDVLTGIAMSTATVYDQIVARAVELGVTLAHVAPTFDIDEAEDLQHLHALLDAASGPEARDDLRATRAALAACGF